jgi:hypothetical protein
LISGTTRGQRGKTAKIQGGSIVEYSNNDDVCNISVKLQKEWARVRRYYGENIVLANLEVADNLRREKWTEQSSPEKRTRVAATKDILRCGFTHKAFQLLVAFNSAAEVKRRLTFAEWQKDYLNTFGTLMGDIPREIKRQGEWWLAAKKTGGIL